MLRTSSRTLDFALEAISSAEGLMDLATEANHRAHQAEEEGDEELRDSWFDQKAKLICFAVLAHREVVVIRPCEGLLSVEVNRSKLHLPKRAIAKHIRGNGYDPQARLSLLRAFRIRPTRYEKHLVESRPKSRPRSRK